MPSRRCPRPVRAGSLVAAPIRAGARASVDEVGAATVAAAGAASSSSVPAASVPSSCGWHFGRRLRLAPHGCRRCLRIGFRRMEGRGVVELFRVRHGGRDHLHVGAGYRFIERGFVCRLRHLAAILDAQPLADLAARFLPPSTRLFSGVAERCSASLMILSACRRSGVWNVESAGTSPWKESPAAASPIVACNRTQSRLSCASAAWSRCSRRCAGRAPWMFTVSAKRATPKPRKPLETAVAAIDGQGGQIDRHAKVGPGDRPEHRPARPCVAPVQKSGDLGIGIEGRTRWRHR